METNTTKPYLKGFVPYALAAFLVGVVGGFTAVLAPAFVSDMRLPYNNTTWTSLAMSASTAAFAPILGKMGDAIGRRKTLRIGIAIFTLGNILTATATSLWFMIFARFIVGIGSAAIAPVVMSYIVTEFPPEKIAKGFSLYMLISSSAVIFGPTLGGFLIEFYGWRAMMWVCVSISFIIFLLCLSIHGKENHTRKSLAKFDFKGSVWVLIFFSLALCLPSFGQNLGINSRWFLVTMLATVLAFTGLVHAEKKAQNPILNRKFMKRKTFVLSVLALFLTQGLMQANMTNIIVFINYTQPHNTIISSYAISIMYVGMSLGSVILGPLADKKEPKSVLAVSFLLTGIGCATMFLFNAQTSVFLLAVALGILGLGLGGNAAIFMKIVLSGVPAEIAGAGTGTYGLFRDLASPFGVAVFVPLFTNRVTSIIASGTNTTTAAIHSVKLLATAEVLCVAIGIIAVLFLPKIYFKKGEEV